MLLKGTKIGITGELTNRPYAAKDGAEKHSLEVRVNDVTLLGSKGDSQAKPQASQQTYDSSKRADPMADLESDIPF